MMRKLSSVAKQLWGRNFSATTWEAPILHERWFWKPIAITKNLALGSLGLVIGYQIASATYHSRSQYVLEQEQRTMDRIAMTKELLRKAAESLEKKEKEKEEGYGKRK